MSGGRRNRSHRGLHHRASHLSASLDASLDVCPSAGFHPAISPPSPAAQSAEWFISVPNHRGTAGIDTGASPSTRGCPWQRSGPTSAGRPCLIGLATAILTPMHGQPTLTGSPGTGRINVLAQGTSSCTSMDWNGGSSLTTRKTRRKGFC